MRLIKHIRAAIILSFILVTGSTTESVSLFDGATCSNPSNCLELIDPNKFLTNVAVNNQLNSHFTFQLDGIKSVRTVFILNHQRHTAKAAYTNPSRITVGNNSDHTQNSICAEITDGGWYDCGQVLYGEYISVYSTSTTVNNQYINKTIRAYAGINVLKDATVFYEPSYTTSNGSVYQASNLLWQKPRTGQYGKHPMYIPGDRDSRDSSIVSCSNYRSMSGLQVVITFELDQPYQVDAVLVIGGDEISLSEFNIYIGMSSNHLSNTACAGGPYAYPLDSSYGGNSHSPQWANGAEAWCDLPGKFVSFVREPSADPLLNTVDICTFGAIADAAIPLATTNRFTDLSFTVSLDQSMENDLADVIYAGQNILTGTFIRQQSGQELSFVTVDNSQSPAQLTLSPTLDEIPQTYELVLETVSSGSLVVYFEDTVSIEVTYCEPDFTEAINEHEIVFTLGSSRLDIDVHLQDISECSYTTIAAEYERAEVEGSQDYDQVITFTPSPDTRSAVISIFSANVTMIGLYSVTVVEQYSIYAQYTTYLINVEVEPCVPNFRPPNRRNFNDTFVYEIGEDSSLEIEFADAVNGNCYFNSTLELNTTNDFEDAFTFQPEILVPVVQKPTEFLVIADAKLTISTQDSTLAGTYSFTYTMEGSNNETSIEFNVDVRAYDQTDSLTFLTESNEESSSDNDAASNITVQSNEIAPQCEIAAFSQEERKAMLQEELIDLDEMLLQGCASYLADLYPVSQEIQRKDAKSAAEAEEFSFSIYSLFTQPPVIEARLSEPKGDGLFSISFSNTLIVPRNFNEIINNQKERSKEHIPLGLSDEEQQSDDRNRTLQEVPTDDDIDQEEISSDEFACTNNATCSVEIQLNEVDLSEAFQGQINQTVQFIQIIGVPYDEKDDLGLEWEIIEATGDHLDFKLSFTDPIRVSQGDGADVIFVLLNLGQFQDANGNVLVDNILLKVLLPRMILEGATADTLESFGETSSSGTKATSTASFLVSIAMSASLNELWGMIHALQIMTHMPLCSIAFPANADQFNGEMLDIANFSFIDDGILLQTVYFPKVDSFNLNFQMIGYTSTYAVPNLGTIFFLAVAIAVLIPIGCCLSIIARHKKQVHKHAQKVHEFLYWKGTIRFLVESYMEMILAVILNIFKFDNKSGYAGVIFSNCYSFLFLTLLVVLPFWIAIFYFKKMESWENEEFDRKWGDVLSGMKKSYTRLDHGTQWIALVYPLMHLLRRIGFIFTVVFFPNFTWLQLASTFTFIQIMWNYLIYFYPMENLFTNRMEIFGELTNHVLMYHMMLFTQFVADEKVRYNIGYSFILFMAIFICVHLFFMLRATLMQIKKFFYTKCASKGSANAQNTEKHSETSATQRTGAIPTSTQLVQQNSKFQYQQDLDDISELQEENDDKSESTPNPLIQPKNKKTETTRSLSGKVNSGRIWQNSGGQKILNNKFPRMIDRQKSEMLKGQMLSSSSSEEQEDSNVSTNLYASPTKLQSKRNAQVIAGIGSIERSDKRQQQSSANKTPMTSKLKLNYWSSSDEEETKQIDSCVQGRKI